MEPSAGISFGGGWASLDGGRLSGFWPNDARYGEAWMHANSIEADSGDYDGGSSDAGAEGGVGAGAGFFDSTAGDRHVGERGARAHSSPTAGLDGTAGWGLRGIRTRVRTWLRS